MFDWIHFGIFQNTTSEILHIYILYTPNSYSTYIKIHKSTTSKQYMWLARKKGRKKKYIYSYIIAHLTVVRFASIKSGFFSAPEQRQHHQPPANVTRSPTVHCLPRREIKINRKRKPFAYYSIYFPLLFASGIISVERTKRERERERTKKYILAKISICWQTTGESIKI